MRITKYNTIKSDSSAKRPMLFKETSVNYAQEEQLNNPKKIVEMLRGVFRIDLMTEEYCYLLCFDTKFNLKGVFEVSHGNVNTSSCCAREIFMKALLCDAAAIVVAHNHPSGDETPSKSDIQAARTLKEAGELMAVPLADFLVIGNGFCSFKERTYI